MKKISWWKSVAVLMDRFRVFLIIWYDRSNNNNNNTKHQQQHRKNHELYGPANLTWMPEFNGQSIWIFSVLIPWRVRKIHIYRNISFDCIVQWCVPSHISVKLTNHFYIWIPDKFHICLIITTRRLSTAIHFEIFLFSFYFVCVCMCSRARCALKCLKTLVVFHRSNNFHINYTILIHAWIL